MSSNNKKQKRKFGLLGLTELVKQKKFSFLLAGLILLLGSIIYWKFLTFESIFIYPSTGGTRDTLYSYWPIAHYISQLIHSGEGIPGWTFSMGIGTNIFTIKKAFLDPLQWLLYIGKPETIPFLLGYLHVLKLLLAGLAFYWYAGLFKFQKFSRLIGGILYAFCGYMMLWGQHYQFATFVITVPLFFGSVELLIQKRNWIVFPLIVGFLSALNFYFFYMLSAFLAFYMLGRLLYLGGLKNGFGIICKSLGLFVLGLGLGAIFSFPYLDFLFHSPRVGESLNFIDQFIFYKPEIYQFIWLRMYGNIIPFMGDAYTRTLFGTFGMQLFAGLLIPLLISQIFALPKRQKKWFIWFVIWFLVLTHFAFFSYWFDQKPKDSRWIIMLVMCVIAVALRGMDQILQKGVNQKYLVGGLLWSVIPLCFISFQKASERPPDVQDWILLGTILGLILGYYFVLRTFRPNQWKSSFLILLICLDVGIAGWLSTHYLRYPLKPKTAKEILSLDGSETSIIKSQDKDLFYRVLHKEPWRDYMTNYHIFQGHKSLTGYTSLHSKSYVEFGNVFGHSFRSFQPSWFFHYNFPDYLIQSFLGVKYKILKHDILAGWENTNWDPEGSNSIFLNQLTFPLVFSFDSYISRSDFKALQRIEKSSALVQASILEEVQEHLVKGKIPQKKDIQRLYNIAEFTLGPGEFSVTEKNNKAEITIPQSKQIFLSEGKHRYTMSIELRPTKDKPVLRGLWYDNTTQKVEKLFSPTIETANVTVHFEPPMGIEGGDLKLEFSKLPSKFVVRSIKIRRSTLDLEKFSEIHRQRTNANFQFTQFKDDHIEGKLKLSKPEIVTFSIPYDRGWQVWVNGEKQKFEKVSIGFLGLILEPGAYDLKLKYIPPGLRLGVGVSLVSFLLFIGLFVFTRRRKQKHSRKQ